MPNPITIHHDATLIESQSGLLDCPYFCNYPLKGIPWDVIKHEDYSMAIQEIDFLGNHLQLIEMESRKETSIRLSVDEPSVFLAIMIEGFVKFQKSEILVSYAMGGVLYMTYSPATDFLLQASAGKHTMMIVCIDNDWFVSASRPFPKLDNLVDCLRTGGHQLIALPMCRFAQPIADLWDSMRMLCSDHFVHKLELANHVTKLIDFYHTQLDNNNCVKGQLSVDIANRLFLYIQKHFTSDEEVNLESISSYLAISPWKVREYSDFVFGRSILKQVRSLRMSLAIQLLETTELPVMAISFHIGYSNLPYFYKIFQRYFGKPPSFYRKEPG